MTDTSEEEGIISSFSHDHLVGVEYPGFVNNVDKMLSTLGGKKSISKAYSTTGRLELRYRPSDPNCKPAYAHFHRTHGLLLKVKRRRRKFQADGTPGPWLYQQEVLGIVHSMFSFDGLMDFQYLTPPSLNDPYKNLFGREILNADQPYFHIPKIFARIDTPGTYNYRGATDQEKVNAEEEDHLNVKRGGDTSVRKKRRGFGLAALFGTRSVPQEPLEENKIKIKSMLEQFPVLQSDVEALKQMFEQRPLWYRGAIESLSRLSKEQFKITLPCFAYYWLNGPWGRLWCKFGYDPRKHPEACRFQQVEVRLKSNFPFASNRRGRQKILQRAMARALPGVMETEDVSASNKPDEIGGKSWQEQFAFNPNQLPSARQVRYQLCDIHDEDIQNLMKNSKVTDGMCTEKDGFLQEGTVDEIRVLLRKRVSVLLLKTKREQKANKNISKGDGELMDDNDKDEFTDDDDDDDEDEDWDPR